MYSITAGSLWSGINSAPWISTESKCRLLEWKGRADLILYCQTGAPCPRPEELIAYRPRIPSGWDEIFRPGCEYEDDNHLASLIRGVATTAQLTNEYEYSHKANFILKNDEEFLKIAHMGKPPPVPCTRHCSLTFKSPGIDSAEQFNRETADQEREIVCAKCKHACFMSAEIQRVTARWPRHVGFAEAWFHVPPGKSNGLAHL